MEHTYINMILDNEQKELILNVMLLITTQFLANILCKAYRGNIVCSTIVCVSWSPYILLDSAQRKMGNYSQILFC